MSTWRFCIKSKLTNFTLRHGFLKCITYLKHSNFSTPLPLFLGKIDMCTHRVFCTKFNAQQLSFETFFNIPNRYSVILATFSPKWMYFLGFFSKQFFSNRFEINLIDFEKSRFHPTLKILLVKAYSQMCVSLITSYCVSNCLLHNSFLSVGNNQKSHGARSELYGACSITGILWLCKKSWMIQIISHNCSNGVHIQCKLICGLH